MDQIKVLIAYRSSQSIDHVKKDLSILKRLRFFEAVDGTECLFKLSNATPHILILEEGLSKRSGRQVVDWILKKGASYQQMGLVLVTDQELPEGFADACASGRLQTLPLEYDSSQLKLAFVRAFNFFTGAKHDEFRVKMINQGDILIREGERADYVYLLQKGRLTAFQLIGGKEETLGDIIPGEFVGEMAYINQDMRSATVVAREDSELVEIPIQFADQIFFQKPSWAKALMKTLSKRLKKSNEKRALS